MTQPAPLTDLAALARQRARATTFFLHEDVAAEIEERLIEVNKRFTKPALVTGVPQFWTNRFPQALCVPDSDILALELGAHDLVIHALSLHWANDPVGQLVQCRRALAPDGLFLGVLFAGQTLVELRACLAEAEATVLGGLSPRVLPMAELRDLGGLLQRAGFALPVADSAPRHVTYGSARALMQDLRGMGEVNALAARRRSPTPRALFAEAERLYHTHFARAGRLPATFDIAFLTGWAPADSQPKPLRPGSAQQRLADALGVTEQPADDPATKRGN